MAILSAGINFGKPATEFIIESDESGIIQSCRNVVTGVEYAGGGGSSDFSTAEVTIVAPEDTNLSLRCSVIDEYDELNGYYGFSGNASFNVVLYKNALLAGIFDEDAKDNAYTYFNYVCSGNAEVIDGDLIITGDCEITLTRR